jgi:hypothetical protein
MLIYPSNSASAPEPWGHTIVHDMIGRRACSYLLDDCCRMMTSPSLVYRKCPVSVLVFISFGIGQHGGVCYSVEWD